MTDKLKEYAKRIQDARVTLVGSYPLAIAYIVANGKADMTKDDAINLWNDALARIHVSKASIDAVTKLLAEVAVIEGTGVLTSDQWVAVYDAADVLRAELEAAEAKAKANKGKAILSPENDRAEVIWRQAVDFAAHWRIVPGSGTRTFNKDAKKKNPTLITLAKELEYTTDKGKILDVVTAVAMTGGKLSILPADSK